jgi:hypothetical protein
MSTASLTSPRLERVEDYVPGAVKFRVRGIPFALRPLDTVGVEAEPEKILNPAVRRPASPAAAVA